MGSKCKDVFLDGKKQISEVKQFFFLMNRRQEMLPDCPKGIMLTTQLLHKTLFHLLDAEGYRLQLAIMQDG